MCDKAHYDALESRVTDLEGEVSELRNDMRGEFAALTEKFDKLIAPVVAEKVKWGDCLRKVVLWAVATILSGAAVAMGVTIWNNLRISV